jgi:hypothetical protein
VKRSGLFALVVLLAGCGGGTSATPSPQASIDTRCVAAPTTLLELVAITLIQGVTMDNVYYVKSNDFPNVFFISGRLHGTPVGDQPKFATWVTNRSDGSAGFFTVDPNSTKYSGWGPASNTGFSYTMANDGAQLSVDCAAG